MADVVTMWGESGTGVSVPIPSMVSKATFDAGSPTDFFATNGVELASGAIKALVDQFDGTILLTDSGAFTGLTLTGMYIYMSQGAGVIQTGWYLVDTDVDNNSIKFEDNGLNGETFIADGNADYTIGGLGEISDPDINDFFQLLLDLMGTSVGVGNNLDILLNQSFTIDQTIDIDNIGGSSTTRHRLIGTNPSFVDDGTQVTITTTTTLANGLFLKAAGGDYITWKNFILDGGGKDSNRAANCIKGTSATTGIFWTMDNCVLTGASSHGSRGRSQGQKFINTEILLNGGSGILSISTHTQLAIVGCDIHDNDIAGLDIRPSGGSNIENNRIYANGTQGILVVSAVSNFSVTGNTLWGNNGNNIELFSGNIQFYLNNNSSSASTTGFGYELNGLNAGSFRYFGHNHSYNNNLGHYSEGDNASWATFAEGGNLGDSGDTINPLFTNVTPGNEDFIPTSSSPLIDAGVGGTGDTIGALCAAAGGGGGGILIHTGMTGGIRG